MYTFFLSNNQYDDNGNRIENKTVSTLGNEVVLYFPDRLHLDENKNMNLELQEHLSCIASQTSVKI